MSVFDLIVIGSGPGGYVAAIRAAQLGASVAVVEQRDLGGVCLNRGCIPTKALYESARVFSAMTNAEKFGLHCGNPTVDYGAIVEKKAAIVARLTKGIGMLFRKNRVQLFEGRGKLPGAGVVEVAGTSDAQHLEAKHVLLATGSEALRPGTFPYDGRRVLSSAEALDLKELPSRVLVVGGGFIGCEFASIWSALGSEVTVVEMLPQLLTGMDADISKEIHRVFRRRKIKVHLETKVEKLAASDDAVTAELPDGRTVEADVALIAVGRKLNTDVEGLADLGVEVENGAVAVDEFGRTNVEGIRAIGDVTGKVLMAHFASEQGIVAVEHLFGESPRPLNEHAVPGAIFTLPEIAGVGLTESRAREEGHDVKVGRFPMQALGRAVVARETMGFVKVVADASGRALGVHIIGHGAAGMIAEASLAVNLGLTVDDLIHTIHAHPTMPEALHEAALNVYQRAIHM